MRTVEAVIDEHGAVHLLEAVQLAAARRALVTLLDDAPRRPLPETAWRRAAARAVDWHRPEEDEAWAYRQPDQ